MFVVRVFVVRRMKRALVVRRIKRVLATVLTRLRAITVRNPRDARLACAPLSCLHSFVSLHVFVVRMYLNTSMITEIPEPVIGNMYRSYISQRYSLVTTAPSSVRDIYISLKPIVVCC